ncbi:MAG TPA: response regulator [Burkholderiaceae bacterium]|jgi:CheY-like chemotaxis protein|nr:response regulator [Burkholderiaceae bacterium]
MDCESEPSPDRQRASARVAVVDDDPLSSSMQAQLVSLLGHCAIVETDPEQAIERALTGQFDLILLDLGMPGLNGFEALRRLREREAADRRTPVPVIAVTGYTSEPDRLRCLMAGFADHVSKPIHADLFEASLRRVLSRSAGEGAAPAASDLQSDVDRLRATAKRLSDVKPRERSFGPTVMEKFALRSQQLIESMRMALSERDPEQLAQSAQAMKSAAEFLGVSRLADMCTRLEHMILTQQWDTAEKILEEIEHGNQAVLTVLFESAR